MLRKIVFAGFALFCFNLLLATLQSCRPESYEERCLPPTCLFIDSSTVELFDEQYGYDLAGPNYYVLATNLRFTLHFWGDNAICYKPTKKQQNISLFSTAYARTPAPCPVFLGRDSIIGYNIYSNKDYDASHPAGSSLNEVFTTDGFHKVNISGRQNVGVECSFHLDAAPLDTGRHVFTIKLAQVDGDTITVSTPEIKLLK